MNKHLYIIAVAFLISFVSVAVQAQNDDFDDPVSILSENSVWTYLRDIRQGTKAGGAFLYELGEDYELQGKTYRKLMLYDNVYELPTSSAKAMAPLRMPEPEMTQLVGIRVEDGRILVNRDEYLAFLDEEKRQNLPYKETADGEIVIYDYNMQVGNKFPSVQGREDIMVERILTVKENDDVAERKLFILSNGLIILEGIGCMNSIGGLLDYLFYDANDLEEEDGCKYSVRLFSYEFMSSEMHRLLFGDEYKAYVPTGVRLTDIEGKNNSSNDYRLDGTRMNKSQPGVYIRKGRKYVVK